MADASMTSYLKTGVGEGDGVNGLQATLKGVSPSRHEHQGQRPDQRAVRAVQERLRRAGEPQKEAAATGYQSTGFAESDGTKDLRATLKGIPTSTSKLRKEAEAQYADTYKLEQESLVNQLSSLIQSQANDSELLNKSYQQSVNTMMAKLRERGLDVGAQPRSTEAALHQYYNEVMDQRRVVYGVQRAGVEAKQKTLEGNYEQNIISRMSQNKLNNLKSATELLTKIASIQSESYQNYINYLLAEKQKKAARSHRGGRRRYYGGGRSYGGRGYYGGGRSYGGRGYYGSRGGSGAAPVNAGSSGLGSNYFANLLRPGRFGSGGKGPGVVNYVADKIKNTAKVVNQLKYQGVINIGKWVAGAKKK